MSDPKEPVGREKREDIRAEYEAEFIPQEPKTGVTLATANTAADLFALLGPSTRQIVQRVELEFRQKVRDLNEELAEMMERETHLKEELRLIRHHNTQLREERDEWRAKSDPAGEIATLREEVAKLRTLHAGSLKEAQELRARMRPRVVIAPKRARKTAKKAKR